MRVGFWILLAALFWSHVLATNSLVPSENEAVCCRKTNSDAGKANKKCNKSVMKSVIKRLSASPPTADCGENRSKAVGRKSIPLCAVQVGKIINFNLWLRFHSFKSIFSIPRWQKNQSVTFFSKIFLVQILRKFFFCALILQNLKFSCFVLDSSNRSEIHSYFHFFQSRSFRFKS